MPRISLIPTKTADGRHIIYTVRVERGRDRLRALVKRALGRRTAPAAT